MNMHQGREGNGERGEGRGEKVGRKVTGEFMFPLRLLFKSMLTITRLGCHGLSFSLCQLTWISLFGFFCFVNCCSVCLSVCGYIFPVVLLLPLIDIMRYYINNIIVIIIILLSSFQEATTIFFFSCLPPLLPLFHLFHSSSSCCRHIFRVPSLTTFIYLFFFL